MTVSPAHPLPSIPTDTVGSYPALAGRVPVDTGRRVLIAMADSAIPVAAYLVMIVATAVIGEAGIWLGLLGLLGVVAASFWALFVRSARLSGIFMRATYLDVETGRPNGGKLFVKFLLQSLLGSVSLGIAPLVMYFATVQEPLKRNWFDRTMGLMLVDERRVHPMAAPHPIQAPREEVQATRPIPVVVPPAFEPAHPAAPHPFPVASGGVDQQGASDAAWDAPHHVGIITSVPGVAPRPPQDLPLQADAPPSVVDHRVSTTPEPRHEPLEGADDQWDHTILSPDIALAAGPAALLDGAVRLTLTPPTVLGRNPEAPGSHPDAVPHAVADPRASKTHVILGEDDRGPWLIDLHSTNGVSVVRSEAAEPSMAVPGSKVHLPIGSVVRFGERILEIVP